MIIDELRQLPQDFVRELLHNLYVILPDITVKLWLVHPLDIAHMRPYLYAHGANMGLLSPKIPRDSVILPGNRQLTTFTPFQQDLILSLQAIRTLVPGSIWRGETAYTQFDKLYARHSWHKKKFRCMPLVVAAIYRDDADALRQLATEPEFQFHAKYLRMAARYGSIRCFRFLQVNQCQFEQATFESACAGGCEEIIQICLEHGGQGTPRALMKAIKNYRNNVAKWLIDVHGVHAQVYHFCAMFKYSNWVMVHHLLLNHFDDLLACGSHNLESIFREIFRCFGSEQFTVHVLTQPEPHPQLPGVLTKHEILARILAFNNPTIANALSTNCYTPYLLAATLISEATAVAADMIAKNDINMLDESGNTALQHAVRERSKEAVDWLLEKGADLNAPTSSPLMWDVVDNLPVLIREMVKRGLNVPSDLFLKSKIGNIQLKDFLLLESKGADIRAVNNNGTNVLLRACCRGSKDLVKYLLDCGLDQNVKNNAGQSVLSIQHLPNTDILDIFGPNLRDGNGLPYFMKVVMEFNHLTDLQICINRNIEIDAVDKDGKNALMLCFDRIKKGETNANDLKRYGDAVVKLLGCNPNLDIVDSKGQTVLMYAIIVRDKITKNILEHKPNVNIQDNEGKTALMHAVIHKRKTTICNLVKMGADHRIVDKAGKRAADYARAKAIRALLPPS